MISLKLGTITLLRFTLKSSAALFQRPRPNGSTDAAFLFWSHPARSAPCSHSELFDHARRVLYAYDTFDKLLVFRIATRG